MSEVAEHATMGQVAKYFGLKLSVFRIEWQGGMHPEFDRVVPGLTADDKRQLQEGIGNGTFTY